MVSTALLTPLELRTRRRDAQSLVRKSYNQLNAALDAWKAADDDGLKAARGVSNASLSQRDLGALPLGVLSQLPGIQDAARAKLRCQIHAQLASLQLAVDDCTAATQQLRATSDLLAAGCDGTTDGQAVFAALPLHLIGSVTPAVSDRIAKRQGQRS
jgi:hypothetical protein